MDHQPASLKGIAKTRWHAQPGYDKEWQARETGFKHTGSDLGWIRYHHLASWQDQPSLEPMEINDSLGYNQTRSSPSLEVVTDLILECKADFQSKDAQLILELNKGPYRFQAVFDGGNCTLIRVDANDNDKSTVLSKTSSGINGEGRHEIRLANVDCRLTVWVDNKVLSFDKGADYTIPHVHQSHPNDRMQPARIGSRGDVTCDSIRIWRDIFYTCGTNGGRQGYGAIQEKFFPPSYNPCSTVQTFYVQPGHYLCFGDNSTSSLDGRMWGLVPERLLLGKAVMVYFPLSRFGVIK
jgi:signal peptidase I